MEKKQVKYVPTEGDEIHLGFSALLFHVVDHPNCTNGAGNPVRTSTVVRVLDNGQFETLNTVFVPQQVH